MNGLNLSEAAHIAVILPPQSISADSSATPINPAFSMKNYKHASILVIAGAEATQDATTLLIYLCATAAGGSPFAIPFNYYFQAAGGAGNDVLGSINNAPATGLVLAAANWPPNGLIVVEIDSDELESASVGGALAGSLGIDKYVGVGLGAPTAIDMASVVVIATGSRFANVASPTITT
jgi:hypothetical protein